jgi:hypothetical protein
LGGTPQLHNDKLELPNINEKMKKPDLPPFSARQDFSMKNLPLQTG